MHAFKNDTQVYYCRYPQKPIAAWPPVFQVFLQKIVMLYSFSAFSNFFSNTLLRSAYSNFLCTYFQKVFQFLSYLYSLFIKTIWKLVISSLFFLKFCIQRTTLKIQNVLSVHYFYQLQSVRWPTCCRKVNIQVSTDYCIC